MAMVEYELIAAQWDEVTSDPGKPLNFRRHLRGDKVKLDEATAARLLKAGAVMLPGQREQDEFERAKANYEAALSALRAVTPPGVIAELTADTDDAASDPGPASVKDIITDVGDDPDKAAAALEAEKAAAEPRVSLVAALEKVIAKAAS